MKQRSYPNQTPIFVIATSISNSQFFRTCFIFLSFFIIVGCDSVEIKFKNKVKGFNPRGLVGTYALMYSDKDTAYIDTISIHQIKKRIFVITINKKDTLYKGDIVKLKGDYYINKYDSATGYWYVNAFRIVNDSINNFYKAFYSNDNKIVENNYFKNVEKTEKDENITYFINNGKYETLKAFDKILDNETGYAITEISPQAETLNLIQDKAILSEGKQPAFNVYPNPFSTQITIEQQVDAKTTIRLLNIKGEEIKTMQLTQLKSAWDLSDVQAGIYFLECSNSTNKLSIVKVIKY